MFWIDQIINVLFVSIFITLPISLILSIRSFIGTHKKIIRFRRIATFAFVTSILGTLILSQMLSSYAYWETKEFLEDLGETYQISVNGELRDDKAKILSLLHNMDNSPFLAHHSHPTKRIKIEIESGRGLLELVFRRDSERPQEYWVFYPKYEHTQEEEIARVTTSIFEDY